MWISTASPGWMHRFCFFIAHPELEEITVDALVDMGALNLVIPEHLAIQLDLTDLKPRAVHLADGSRKLVRGTGPVKVEMIGRDCVTPLW